MPVRLTFELELLSDYHVGAGFRAPEGADSAVLRDVDRIPVLRGSTLRPLMREGLRRLLALKPLSNVGVRCVASGRTDGETPDCCAGPRTCPACSIFGSPRQAGRWRVSSARPIANPRAAAGPQLPAETHITHRVRISPRGRRAAPNQLFSREEGDGRLRFIFWAECRQADCLALKEAVLLVASARMVRFLGSSRRRGSGECRIDLTKVTGLQGAKTSPSSVDGSLTEAWLTEFDRIWLEGKEPTLSISPVPKPRPELKKQSDERCRYLVVLRTEEPLLIARRAEAANEFESLEYIPGSVLLGALAGRAAGLVDLKDPEGYRTFHQLFRAGRVSFPMLYRCLLQREFLRPAAPVARSLFSCSSRAGWGDETPKGHGVELWPSPTQACRQCGGRLKPLGDRFVTVSEAPRLLPTARILEMHNRINPWTQRVSSGDLYGYQVIAPGQFFAGELACDRSAFESLLQASGLRPGDEENRLRLGKATGRGYGEVLLTLTESPLAEPLGIGSPLAERLQEDDGELTMTLLTDAILIDEWGCFHASLADWLARELEIDTADAKEACVVRPVDGFNDKHGLPRWRDFALEAGSTVRLRLEPERLKALSPQLEKWEASGVGLRRWEGFGRVVFNHPIFLKRTYLQPPAFFEVPQSQRFGLEPESETRTERLFREAWNSELITRDSERLFASSAPAFCALGRLIWAEADFGISRVRERLKTLGKLESLIGEELKGRDKADPFSDAPEGLKQVIKLLARLEQLLQQDEYLGAPRVRLESLGLRRLADWISKAACGGDREGAS